MKEEKGKKNRTKFEAGGSTLEILIAFVVLTLSITAVILVGFGNQSVSVDAETNSDAIGMSQEILEDARATSRGDFFAVANAASTEDVGPLSYLKELEVIDISECKKEIRSRVSWNNDPNRNQYVSLSTILTDVAGALALGLDCDTELPGEWDNPQTYGSVDLNPSGNKGTGLDLVQRGLNSYALLTSSASAVAKPDFWTIDVTDPQNPNILGNLDVGEALNKVDGNGGWAFAVGTDPNEQLQIINISDLSDPFVVATSSLPGVDPAGSFPGGVSIYYYGDRIYIGTKETAGPEFHVFDVSTPASPIHLGSLELFHNVNDIVVVGTNAYLATSDNSGELMIIDVSTPGALDDIAYPSSPYHPDNSGWKYNAPGNQDGTSLYVASQKVYLGRKRGSGDPSDLADFHILSVTSPGAIVELGSKDLGINSNTEVKALVIRGPLAFLATTHSNSEFQVWNIQDPANITSPSSCNIYNFPAKPTDIDFANNYGFLSVDSNDGLRVVYDSPEVCPI
jgi:hypothetical protein